MAPVSQPRLARFDAKKQGNRVKTIMDGKAVAEADAGAAPVGFRFGNSGTVSRERLAWFV